MKILKIFGVVVGIHVFALILIFANPGCSSTSKPTPAPSDTAPKSEPAATVSVPLSSPATVSSNFNPDAPATTASSASNSVRFVPTRPNTPAAQAVTAAPVGDVTPAQTYTVKAGDSLWELGKKFKVPYGEIAAANGLKSSSPLHAGQKLIIPGTKPTPASGATPGPKGALSTSKAPTAAPVTTAAAPAGSSSANGGVKHTVQPGETLGAIAHKYGVSVKELGTANNISDPAKVKAGVELVIPGWTATGSSKAASKTSKAGATPATPTETKPLFNLLDSGTPASTTPPAANEPPVIRVDDSPLSPAPKGK